MQQSRIKLIRSRTMIRCWWDCSIKDRDDNRYKCVKNVNCDNDIKQTFQYTRWFLTFLGIWPITKSSDSSAGGSRRISFIIILTCTVMIVFTFIPGALHTAFREKKPLRRLILMGPVSSSFASFLKYALMVLRAKDIKKCVEKIENNWITCESENELAIMRRNATIGRGITIVCSLFLYTGGMSYHTILPILKGSKINEYNVTIRPLVYPGYDIFIDPQASPTYEILFFLICVSAFVRYTVTITICNLAAVFVSHVCGQIEIVILRLNILFDGIVDADEQCRKIIEKRLSLAIQCHARSLRLTFHIDRALRDIFLIEVVASTGIICLLEYYLMTVWNNSEIIAIMTYFILLTSYVFNIFILCHIGELLKGQFQKIGRAAYMIDWPRLSEKNGLAIVPIMAVSNSSRQLTAGHMMEFSMSSFGIIMKTSVMYLNMLRAIAV
ncbi:putative odorant receptor 92a isoform X1 [Venturia canescens]|uniref:putative odorant receptor 92a isoform X1 n=1 Tax=Venturia canescens TaxID=32260 RepID=UPI001C9D2047|nr:putative odorant receptor 92a isoform X1 [Venturia canescens]